jgi:hypothetical protein
VDWWTLFETRNCHRRVSGSRPPLAFKKHHRTRLPSPLGALRGSGGLLEFLWNADHQTLTEGRFHEALRRVTPYLEKLLEEAPLCVLASWNAKSKAGRSDQAGRRLKSDVLPVVPKEPRFVDFLSLSDKINLERLMCISFWTLREGAPSNIAASAIT